MKWVEIISLRSPVNISTEFVDELLKEIGKADRLEHPAEIRIYRHSVVETDLSIHIHWESEPESQHKSPLGLKFSYALKGMGLLNHSVWIETKSMEYASFGYGNSKPQGIPEADRKGSSGQAGPGLPAKEGR